MARPGGVRVGGIMVGRWKFAALASSALFGLAGAAQAATIVQTLDLTTVPIVIDSAGASITATAIGSLSARIALGDTLDLTIAFAPGQQLRMVDPGLIWGFLSSRQPEGLARGTGTLTLLAADGSDLVTSRVMTDEEGQFHFGQYFLATDFAALPRSVTFAGLHYVGTLDSFESGRATAAARTYDAAGLFVSAASLRVLAGTSDIPEPASWAMMVAGFALSGGLMRGRARPPRIARG